MNSKLSPCILLFAILFASPYGVFSQTTGSLSGTVRDSSGAVLPLVEVAATHTDTGHIRRETTDDQGRYQIDRVPPGGYTLVAWYEGVVRQTRSVTVPEDGGTVDVDFILR